MSYMIEPAKRKSSILSFLRIGTVKLRGGDIKITQNRFLPSRGTYKQRTEILHQKKKETLHQFIN